ncbi:putative protein of unknown function (DUF4598) [Monocercomonoides exilis]|uniref:putative protein of unknown function (DUF4598) n=1 Tax=Monocercomonoides exilis TaxID=2049356 RepID=UPI0035593FB5|nr:putative protein of unknown function (DUF4598) [Monocercomonoides exilis]|eukprot:MONOS_10232.1-p1 / transcript=MONOS_10232.1 / gene=MONOS_10232 / organism=Monocercomonoides_exilis_PA203 / gene_product=unspecified product / transcript_product=unspecified product / location=Mono_scaffold00456:35778-36308(-) / protein_length=122 / sequence_SO=supercontig / SO=protein_coding / is_pseudo=false
MEKEPEKRLISEIPSNSKEPDDPMARYRENMLPPSSALSRAKAFLPLLQSSNQELEKKLISGEVKTEDLDPENVDPNSEFVVEMDLALGVFEKAPEQKEKKIVIPGLTDKSDGKKPSIQELK